MTPERCWISSAIGPSSRRQRVPGSGSLRSRARDHWIFSGWACSAISAPTISAQRVTNSLDAKPCLAKASVRVLCRRSERRWSGDLAGLFIQLPSVTSGPCSPDERSDIRGGVPGFRPSPLKLRRANVSEAAEALAKAASLMRATTADVRLHDASSSERQAEEKGLARGIGNPLRHAQKPESPARAA